MTEIIKKYSLEICETDNGKNHMRNIWMKYYINIIFQYTIEDDVAFVIHSLKKYNKINIVY